MTQKANKRYIRRSLKKQRGGNADCTKCVTVVNMTKKLLETMQDEISKQEDTDFKTSMMTYSTTIISILTKHEEEQKMASAVPQLPLCIEPVNNAAASASASSNNNNMMHPYNNLPAGGEVQVPSNTSVADEPSPVKVPATTTTSTGRRSGKKAE